MQFAPLYTREKRELLHHMLLLHKALMTGDNCQGYFSRTNADDWLQGAERGGQSVNMHKHA